MRFLSKILFLVFVIISVFLISCLKSKKPGIPAKTQEILNNSSIFKPGLMSVILEFQKPKDSIKLNSAYFLIENLDINYTIKQSLYDTLDNPIELNIKNYPNLTTIKLLRDSIERVVGDLKYETDSIWLDFKHIGPDFLINHINLSYNNWKNNNLLLDYDIETYYNYILPYRVANEEPELYLDLFRKKYANILADSSTLLEIVYELNDKINSYLNYDERLVLAPNPQTIKQTEESRSGDLRDINIYKIKVFRSLGIAAVLDYTPYFCDSVLGYYSTTVILPNNDKIHLTNPDNNINPYKKGKVAKIYRRIHTSNPSGLFTVKDKKTHTPSFLGNFNYIDVTNEYIPTKNINIGIDDTSTLVYLSVYNDEEWKPIEWAFLDEDGTALFKNMGMGIRYLPTIVSNKKIVPIGKEIYLE